MISDNFLNSCFQWMREKSFGSLAPPAVRGFQCHQVLKFTPNKTVMSKKKFFNPCVMFTHVNTICLQMYTHFKEVPVSNFLQSTYKLQKPAMTCCDPSILSGWKDWNKHILKPHSNKDMRAEVKNCAKIVAKMLHLPSLTIGHGLYMKGVLHEHLQKTVTLFHNSSQLCVAFKHLSSHCFIFYNPFILLV